MRVQVSLPVPFRTSSVYLKRYCGRVEFLTTAGDGERERTNFCVKE